MSPGPAATGLAAGPRRLRGKGWRHNHHVQSVPGWPPDRSACDHLRTGRRNSPGTRLRRSEYCRSATTLRTGQSAGARPATSGRSYPSGHPRVEGDRFVVTIGDGYREGSAGVVGPSAADRSAEPLRNTASPGPAPPPRAATPRQPSGSISHKRLRGRDTGRVSATTPRLPYSPEGADSGCSGAERPLPADVRPCAPRVSGLAPVWAPAREHGRAVLIYCVEMSIQTALAAPSTRPPVP